MTDETPALGAKLGEPPPPLLVNIPPVLLTLIGSKNDLTPVEGTVAITPGTHQPNIVVQRIITPFVAITVRFANTFATSVLGFMTLQMVPAGSNQVMLAIHGLDFYHLLLTGAGVALAPAGYDLLRNIVTILGKLEQKYPLMTGTV